MEGSMITYIAAAHTL